MGAPHAGQLVALELIAWPQSLHLISFSLTGDGVCFTTGARGTGGGGGDRGDAGGCAALRGISIC